MKFLNKINNITQRTKTIDLSTQQIIGNDSLDWLSKIKVTPVAVLAFASLIVAAYMYVDYSQKLDSNRQKISYISDLRQLSERIEKSAIQVRSADKGAFEDLENSKNNIEKLLNVLQKGGKIGENDTKINPMDEALAEKFNKVVNDWNGNKSLINSLITQKTNLTTLKNEVENIKTKTDTILDSTISVQKLSDPQNRNQSIISQELILLNNRIISGLDDLFTGESFSLERGYSLIKDLKQFNYFVTALEKGNDELGISEATDPVFLAAVKKLQKEASGFVDITSKIIPQIENLYSAKDVAKQVSISSKNITNTAQELNASTSETKNLNIYRIFSILLFTIAVMCSALLASIFRKKSISATKMAAHFKKNQNNEQAVKDLLDQITPLENGDFSKVIHVEDKFITPISDRFDTTRKKFGDIVRQVKFTSDEVFNSSKKTEETSQNLLEVSGKQYDKLGESISKIGKLSTEMDELAQITFLAQEESNSSREASIKGEALVKQSIEKMDQIRNTIQESSKKIKKLGESAQSITEVTSLIQDITKQINVLALNAAIQAASSGESGREFTVVAQEVQRLAFDSESATKKIAEIISEIQSDTAIAVSSMERTTQEVVIGAQLTDKAGSALKEIEKLADSVANRVASAADQLIQQSSDMATVAIDMRELQSITEKSGDIIKLAASQVEALKTISEKLETSVNIYKVE